MRILVFISGFGNPHIEHKMKVLEHNLRLLDKTRPDECCLDVWVAQYDDTVAIPEAYRGYVSGEFIVYHQKGFVGDFFLSIATPERVKGYEFLFCVLDDVLLQDTVNLAEMIQLKEDWNLNIVSPSLNPQGKFMYPYMLSCEIPNLLLKIVNKCEYFCYLIDYRSYCQYHTFFHKANPYMWGMDCILFNRMGLRVGLINTMTIVHYFQHESYKDLEVPRQALRDYLEYYKVPFEIIFDKNVVRQMIYDYTQKEYKRDMDNVE